jgi:DNA-binding IclR family transcriptional regulator
VSVESRGIQSVDVGARLLAALVEASEPMMLRDLAEKANLAAGQAHVYLTSFKKFGLVEQARGNGHYRIGPFATRLAMARLHSDVLLQRATDVAGGLSLDLGATVTLTVWGSGAATVLLVRDGPEELTVNLRPGRVYNVVSTATGRLFAAFRSSDDVQKRIRYEIESGFQTSDRKKALLSELQNAVAAARVNGFTVAENAPVPGINAVAAPVLDPAGEIQLALTVVGRSTTLDVTLQGRPARVLKDAALAVSQTSDPTRERSVVS